MVNILDKELLVKELIFDMAADGANPPILQFLIDNFDDYSNHLAIIKHVYNLQSVDTERLSNDAWSRGQLLSKNWLLDKLIDFDLDLGSIWTLCGWVGSLGFLMSYRRNKPHYTAIRSFDIDNRCAVLAETLNRPAVKSGWQFKATTMDVNQITYDDFSYQTKKYDGSLQTVVDSADTIINTSCDHMGSDNTWWDNIPTGKLLILQNNNWHENDQHNNSVDSIDQFQYMYPMNELLYSGALDCKLYTRFMMIGRK